MIKGLSLFANVGIAETYLKEVGVDIVVANELLPERARFYKHVYPECEVITGDITKKEIANKVIEESKKRNVEFIIATPPCQGMSLAGNKDPNDARNFLITYSVDIFKALKPKYILIENVVQSLSTEVTYNGKKMLIPEMIETELGNDYIINKNHIMNTEKLGVSQKRLRALFLMVRKDIGIEWNIPTKKEPIVTVRDAIGDLPSLDPFVREEEYRKFFPDYEKKRKAGLKVSKWHYARPHVWRNVEVMMHTPTGCSAKKNPVYYPKNNQGKMVGGSGSTYMRMDWDKPAPTVTTYNHTISSLHKVHPGSLLPDGTYSDPRVLTVLVLMRITTLPDNWNIPNWATESLVRVVIGEGIPPLAIKKVVAELHLEDKKDD